MRRLLKNQSPKYTIIGEISIAPKEGTNLFTNLKLGLHKRYIASIIVYTNLFLVLIILKLTNHIDIMYIIRIN